MRGYVSVLDVVEFVARAMGHGVPRRIAYQRAAKHFGVDPHMVKVMCTSAPVEMGAR